MVSGDIFLLTLAKNGFWSLKHAYTLSIYANIYVPNYAYRITKKVHTLRGERTCQEMTEKKLILLM